MGPWAGHLAEQEQFTTADFTHDLCDKIFWIENNQHFYKTFIFNYIIKMI